MTLEDKYMAFSNAVREYVEGRALEGVFVCSEQKFANFDSGAIVPILGIRGDASKEENRFAVVSLASNLELTQSDTDNIAKIAAQRASAALKSLQLHMNS